MSINKKKLREARDYLMARLPDLQSAAQEATEGAILALNALLDAAPKHGPEHKKVLLDRVDKLADALGRKI